MKAVILAGGKGTRLRPYTVSFPKPLVPVGDYPILEVIVRQLARQGFSDITISTGHLAELIEAYFGDGSRWDVKIDYVRERQPLSTAGALQLLNDCPDHFLVMNGDVLTTLDYRAFFEEHMKRGAMASVATAEREAMIDFGVVDVAADGSLAGWREKPRFPYDVSMGVYVISEAARHLIVKGESLGMPDLLLRVKDGGGLVYCHRSECDWLDIGRVDDYQRAQEIFEHSPGLYLGDES